jgi:hypothetical protein
VISGRHKQQLKDQALMLKKAGIYIEYLKAQSDPSQALAEKWEGGESFTLSQMEGQWETEVRWAEGPAGMNAVISVSASEAAPELKPLTVWGLATAFPDRAELEDLRENGWALVRAWPINAPGLLEQLPGFKANSYVLCSITAAGLNRELPEQRPTEVRAPARGFETHL